MSLDESFFNGTTVLLLGNFETTLTRALFGPTPRPPNGFQSTQNLAEAFAVKVSRGNMLDTKLVCVAVARRTIHLRLFEIYF